MTLLACLQICGIAWGLPAQQNAESSINTYNTSFIKVCGVGLALGNPTAVRESCLRNARYKAAEKAVARFIAPSAASDSLFRQVVNRNNLYVTDQIKIVKEQQAAGKLFLFCEVPVNFEKIEAEIKQQVMLMQKQNHRDKAVFLVRMTDMPAGAPDKIWHDVLVQYEEAFRIYNFKALGAEAAGTSVMMMLDTVKNIDSQHLPYAAYKENVLKELQQVAEVSIAVIGEIRIVKLVQYADGVYAETICNTEIVRLQQEGYEEVGKFNDTYNAIRANQNDALAIVAQEAAVKSSKYLADITYNYWQNKKMQ